MLMIILYKFPRQVYSLNWTLMEYFHILPQGDLPHNDLLNAEAVFVIKSRRHIMESTWWALLTNEDTFTDFEGGMMDKSYKQNNLIDVVEDAPTINCADYMLY